MAPAKERAPEERAYRHPQYKRLTLHLPALGRDVQFLNGAYRTSDPAEQAELEGATGEAAGVYEDDEVETHRCTRCDYATASKRALAAHQRSEHA